MLHQYNATPKTRTNGEIVNHQETDENGNAKMTLGVILPGQDAENGVQRILPAAFTPFNINSATTTVIKSGAGYIDEIRVVGGTLGNITIYDNTAASGTVLMPAATPVSGAVLLKNVPFSTGLTIVTAAATVVVGTRL
jgi:hypothetical protein